MTAASRVGQRALVVAFALSLVTAGCYDSHGGLLFGVGSPVPRDAGPLAPPTRDASDSPRLDASRRDAAVGLGPDAPFGRHAPATCPLARPDASCVSSFAMPAGTPFGLPFQFDGCGCCTETTCDVTVDAAARTLRLSTRLCPDPCDCDGCYTPRGTCSVPPLPHDALGQWTVEVNDVDAFVIGVVDAFDPTLGPPPGCATYAEPDTCGAPVDFTMGPVRGDICVEHVVLSDREALRLHAGCWTCGDIDSVCESIVTPRFTDDLPPGGDITLDAPPLPDLL